MLFGYLNWFTLELLVFSVIWRLVVLFLFVARYLFGVYICLISCSLIVLFAVMIGDLGWFAYWFVC